MPACHKCGRGLNADADYGRQDTCQGCRNPTRVCLNCKNYDKSQYNDCSEPAAERVVEKEKSNFCDYFKPSEKTDGAASGLSARELAIKAAEDLFKKKS